MTLKVIFLDFDGVMNSGSWTKERLKLMSRKDRICDDAESDAKWVLEPARILLLNQALEKTKAVVVVTSSWRGDGHGIQMLRFAGLVPDAIGETVSARRDLGLEYLPNTRSESLRPPEIQHWLKTHPEIESYVVLDDVDIEIDNFIHVDGMFGLQRIHVELIVSMLSL